jgi:hypothetical protein
MPLPSPHQGESQQDFVSRCMVDSSMRSDFPKQEQRAAVCHQQWRDAKKTEAPVRDIGERT